MVRWPRDITETIEVKGDGGVFDSLLRNNEACSCGGHRVKSNRCQTLCKHEQDWLKGKAFYRLVIPSLIGHLASVDVKQHESKKRLLNKHKDLVSIPLRLFHLSSKFVVCGRCLVTLSSLTINETYKKRQSLI